MWPLPHPPIIRKCAAPQQGQHPTACILLSKHLPRPLHGPGVSHPGGRAGGLLQPQTGCSSLLGLVGQPASTSAFPFPAASRASGRASPPPSWAQLVSRLPPGLGLKAGCMSSFRVVWWVERGWRESLARKGHSGGHGGAEGLTLHPLAPPVLLHRDPQCPCQLGHPLFWPVRPAGRAGGRPNGVAHETPKRPPDLVSHVAEPHSWLGSLGRGPGALHTEPGGWVTRHHVLAYVCQRACTWGGGVLSSEGPRMPSPSLPRRWSKNSSTAHSLLPKGHGGGKRPS